jgi:hypothetical protein
MQKIEPSGRQQKLIEAISVLLKLASIPDPDLRIRKAMIRVLQSIINKLN